MVFLPPPPFFSVSPSDNGGWGARGSGSAFADLGLVLLRLFCLWVSQAAERRPASTGKWVCGETHQTAWSVHWGTREVGRTAAPATPSTPASCEPTAPSSFPPPALNISLPGSGRGSDGGGLGAGASGGGGSSAEAGRPPRASPPLRHVIWPAPLPPSPPSGPRLPPS